VSGSTSSETDDELIAVVSCMTNNLRDLEMVRRLVKRISDYEINLSSEEKTEQLFLVAARATNYDWVICQQFAVYLVHRGKVEQALSWASRALDDNPEHPPLHHTKGNVLRRWGMELLSLGDTAGAEEKFHEARKCFASARTRRNPDEYGYVTHLDMLLGLLKREVDVHQIASLKAEGVQLYSDGLKTVSEDRYNMLLEDRFRETFGLGAATSEDLIQSLDEALTAGRTSVYAGLYLAQHKYEKGDYTRALEVLRRQREITTTGVLTWVKEAELHAREGHYSLAATCLDSAKRREKAAETTEASWKMWFWDLLVSVILEDFKQAATAAARLDNAGILPRRLFPVGYVWKEGARDAKPGERVFRKHAKVWSGRVELVKTGGQYGLIAITNHVGQRFNVRFNPRYFSRKDIRKGDPIEFVLAILPGGLRADDVTATPFTNTTDDLFVP